MHDILGFRQIGEREITRFWNFELASSTKSTCHGDPLIPPTHHYSTQPPTHFTWLDWQLHLPNIFILYTSSKVRQRSRKYMKLTSFSAIFLWVHCNHYDPHQDAPFLHNSNWLTSKYNEMKYLADVLFLSQCLAAYHPPPTRINSTLLFLSSLLSAWSARNISTFSKTPVLTCLWSWDCAGLNPWVQVCTLQWSPKVSRRSVW